MSSPLDHPHHRDPGNGSTRRLSSLRRTHVLLSLVVVAAFLLLAGATSAQSRSADRTGDGQQAKPTIVLVHGSWADASSWNAVISRLLDDGYRVHAIPNPLRSISGDAAYVRTFLDSLSGPIVLVGHSYGGAVITNAAAGNENVRALVYVDAFAPDEGENLTQLLGPDSALSVDPTTVFDFVPAALPPSEDTDVYLKTSTVFTSFANGLSARDKALVAATQRPGRLGALFEASGPPAWETIPSWFLVGTQDRIIPASSQRAMAERAGSNVTEIHAGHLSMVTDPNVASRLIERAARATCC
jgi:pimeloyl-ACP methyl ester carboxylesterase